MSEQQHKKQNRLRIPSIQVINRIVEAGMTLYIHAECLVCNVGYSTNTKNKTKYI